MAAPTESHNQPTESTVSAPRAASTPVQMSVEPQVLDFCQRPLPNPSHSSPISPEHSTVLASSSEGLVHWELCRREWTRNHKPYDESADCFRDYHKHASVGAVDRNQFDGVYNNLVTGRRFARPVPLNFVTAVLIHGWKKEGLWEPAPPEAESGPAKMDSDNDN